MQCFEWGIYMKNLFIDANIWLSLYHFSNDDLEQFSKLKELLGTDIRLYIPKQICNEVQRNRDAKIKDALGKFESFSFNFPAFSKNYDEYIEFSKKFNELKKEHRDWLKKVKDDIKNQTLSADVVIQEFFDSVEIIDCDSNMIQLAEIRYKAGNPPGKDNKYGDAINWECLLQNVPDQQDLYFVSADRDYASVIDDNSFNLFLQKEWQEKKTSKIIFFKSLVSFLKEHFEDIKLQTEQEKDDLIQSLFVSASFATTHALIKSLKNYSDWNEQQKDDLFEACVNNNQVNWILEDTDVYEFYLSLFEGQYKETEDSHYIKERLERHKEELDFDDIDI